MTRPDPLTIPRVGAWPFPSERSLNTQDSLPTVKVNDTAHGKVPRLVYGNQFVGGRLLVTPNYNNGTWTAAWALGVGEFSAINSVLLNGAAPPAGVLVNTYTGTTTQTADPLLTAAIAGFTDTHVLTDERGSIGFAYVVVQYSNDDFPAPPTVLCNVDGRKVYDPDTDSVIYSENPALIRADLIKDPWMGLGEPVDNASLSALKAECDATVTTEPRRRLGITLETRRETVAWLESLRVYDAGWSNKRDGVWFFRADRPSTADLVIDATADDIVRGSFSVSLADESQVPTVVKILFTDTSSATWHERQVCYPDPDNHPGDPAVTVRRESALRMPGVHRYSQARREAKERYNRLQRTKSIAFVGHDHMLQLERGDVIDFTHPMGFTNELFRLTEKPVMVSPGRHKIVAVEYNAADYDDSEDADPGTTGTAGFVGELSTLSQLPYISLEDGIAIQDGVGTLTVKAKRAGADITTGTIQLYVGGTLVTQANGFAAGSDGYTGVFDAGDINGLVVVELKDGPTGDILDSQSLLDVADGGVGEDGLVGVLSNQAHVVAADRDGGGYSLTNAGGLFVVFDGQTDVTGTPAYSVVGSASKNGLTMSINAAGVYSLSGASWSSANETFKLRANYLGVNIDLDYSIAKGRAGADAPNVILEPAFTSWVQSPGGTWAPTATTNDVAIKARIGGAEVATETWRITRDAAGLLTAAILSSNDPLLAVTVAGSGTEALTLLADYVDGSDVDARAITITTAKSGTDGANGADGTDGADGAQGPPGSDGESLKRFEGVSNTAGVASATVSNNSGNNVALKFQGFPLFGVASGGAGTVTGNVRFFRDGTQIHSQPYSITYTTVLGTVFWEYTGGGGTSVDVTHLDTTPGGGANVVYTTDWTQSGNAPITANIPTLIVEQVQ